MSPYHQIQVFLSKMALFVLTHDTVLTSSYVTLTDEEYLTMTARCREMNKYVFMAMMEMHWIQKKCAEHLQRICNIFSTPYVLFISVLEDFIHFLQKQLIKCDQRLINLCIFPVISRVNYTYFCFTYSNKSINTEQIYVLSSHHKCLW